jgi:hypothetical protein
MFNFLIDGYDSFVIFIYFIYIKFIFRNKKYLLRIIFLIYAALHSMFFSFYFIQ